MGSKSIPFDEYKAIYSRVPRLTVDVIIRSQDGIIFLLRKNDGWEGMWHVPGSTVKFKETLEEAVKRTAREEAGVEVTNLNFLDHMHFLDEETERGFGYTISATFTCDLVSGNLQYDEDSSAIESFKEIPENIVPEQGELLRKHWPKIKTAW